EGRVRRGGADQLPGEQRDESDVAGGLARRALGDGGPSGQGREKEGTGLLSSPEPAFHDVDVVRGVVLYRHGLGAGTAAGNRLCGRADFDRAFSMLAILSRF